MNNNLDEKRKEIFELHQSWLRSEAPLMRKFSPTATDTPKDQKTQISPSKKNWVIIGIISVTAALVILEFLLFASELGWLN